MGQVSLTVRDYDNEPSVVAFSLPDITAANADAVYADALALQQAMDAICTGLLVSKKVTALTSPLAVGRSSDPTSAREAKMRIAYHDSITFEKAGVEVPSIDLSLQLPGHPGYFYIAGESGTNALIDAFRTEFESSVVGPGGNASVISEMYHVGRAT